MWGPRIRRRKRPANRDQGPSDDVVDKIMAGKQVPAEEVGSPLLLEMKVSREGFSYLL
jgi:hypothetical protein